MSVIMRGVLYVSYNEGVLYVSYSVGVLYVSYEGYIICQL